LKTLFIPLIEIVGSDQYIFHLVSRGEIMYQSIVHILLRSIEKFPNKDALRYRKNGSYTGLTYRQMGDQIELISRGLIAIGLKPGDRIAILSYNRPEWPIADFAIFSMRGLVVPIYHTLPAGQIAYILKDSGARAIFVEDKVQHQKIMEIREQCKELEFVFSFSKIAHADGKIISWPDLLDQGQSHRKAHPEEYLENVNAINPEEICTLVYTSGTTGHPKGVMLHHQGFVKDVINSEAVFGLYPEDVFLSFLPLSHLYERLGGHWCPLYRGSTIAYADDINSVVDDIQLVRPTVMVSVPRLYEKISSKVIEQVEAGPPLRKKIFYWALKTGRHFHELKFTNRKSRLATWKYHIAEKLVFSKIKQKLGGRFRFPISGGAPLSTETLKFFEAMGLQIVEGYGMTETHLIISLTPPGSTKYGSCGKPIPEVDVRIADDGEILVRGETIMAGYYGKNELTKEVIDRDGWLHTGDIGHLDDDNYLYITDRKKNILVTAGGKNVAPAPIEHALKRSKFIEDVCLVGDQRKFISAIIVPNFENLKIWADKQNITFSSETEVIENEKIIEMFSEEIESLQSDFARYEKIKKFILLTQPLTVENGELTPSLKIKRNVVEKRFKEQIDQVYLEA
jgi:long-chain acyl-CoA synthetase